jgi:hypothetical protein
MKMLRSSLLCFVVLFLVAPSLRAQDLSKYRQFALGMNLNALLEQTSQKMADVRMICARPALIQELVWWPTNIPGSSLRSDSIEQIQFSFYNAELYKISVTYDRISIEGLSEDDISGSISAKYGPVTSVALAIDSATTDRYDSKGKTVASWEDSQYSLNLVRYSLSSDFGLVIYSKPAKAEAEVAIAEAAKLDKQEGPRKEADLQKKRAKDLAATRQKNLRTFRP